MNNETTKENGVIDALKRLERAGSENSRTTQKLRAASVVIADEIVKSVEAAQAESVELPRGYVVVDQYSNIGCFTQLRTPSMADGWEDSRRETLNSDSTAPGEKYLHGDFNKTFFVAGRESILQFAADIADGLLDEIAEFLEKRATENEAQAVVLEGAKI